MSALPKPQRNDGGTPCGECRIQPGETCDVCGAMTPRPDSMLRGQPKEQPCGWCRASRAVQVTLTYSADDDTPLCEACWAKEYGDDFDR